MKTIRIPMILAAALGTMAGCTTPLTVEVEPGQLSPADTAEPIAQDTTIFTVIEHIDDDKLTLRMLHSVMSAHADTILFVGDEIHVALEPLLPKNNRRGSCATAILGRQGQGMGRIVPGTDSGRHPACLARLQDFRGAEGLPVHDIHLNQVARVMLTGDLVFDGQGVTAPIRRCDEFQTWSADFLKKTWQLFKPVDGQAHNTCVFDGDPRPLEQRTCRSGGHLEIPNFPSVLRAECRVGAEIGGGSGLNSGVFGPYWPEFRPFGRHADAVLPSHQTRRRML